MCQLNTTVSDSADISFSEINASATTAKPQHELAKLGIEYAKQQRRDCGELKGNVHAMAAGLMLNAGIPDYQVEAVFVAEGHE